MGRVPVPRALAAQVVPEQKVTLGFRSEHGRLITEGQSVAPGTLAIRAEVLNSEPNFAQHYQLVNVQAAGVIFGVQAPLDLHAKEEVE